MKQSRCSCLLLFFSLPAVVSAQVVGNGSFETGSFSPWTTSGGRVSIQSFVVPPDGSKFCAFNDGDQSNGGVLTQTIATTNGVFYRLTFYQGIAVARTSGSQTMKVKVTGASELANVSYTMNASGSNHSFTQRTIDFVANSTSTVLEFKDGSTVTNSIDLLLDLVVVTPFGDPAIMTQPVDQYSTVTPVPPDPEEGPHSVTFTLTASGTAPITYQWKKEGEAISGATSSSYTIQSVAATDAGDYTCTVTNANGSVTSNAAKLTVPITPTLLEASETNGRYFRDASGKAVYLTGAHTFLVIEDLSTKPSFNYLNWFRFMASKGHNFLRAWQMDRTKMQIIDGDVGTISPFPFKRTGPDQSGDGVGLKFNLDQYDDAYFTRLRNRCIEAERHGLYVSIMLFDGIWRDNGDPQVWAWHPYNPLNNVNAQGLLRSQVYTMTNTAWLNSMKAYARRIVDEVNDLDNVLYEIANETPFDSEIFQNEIAEEIHNYELNNKPKQHMVGMTAYAYGNGSAEEDACFNSSLETSNADWISPSSRNSPYAIPDADEIKVRIWDSDHTWGFPYSLPSAAGADWVWRGLTHGQNPIYLSTPPEISSTKQSDPAIENAMGWARTVALRCDLDNMVPTNGTNTVSTGHALVHTQNTEYLVYQPLNSEFTVSLPTQTLFNCEWVNPITGETTSAGIFTSTSSGVNTFPITPGHTEGAVLHLFVPVVTSRKTHGPAGTFDIQLPLMGSPGIECRLNPEPNPNEHQVVFRFASPVTVANATVTPAPNKTATISGVAASGNEVSVSLTNVANIQTLSVALNGVSDGENTGDVSVEMGVLLGDVNASGVVTGSDVNIAKAQQSKPFTPGPNGNFDCDVNASGIISGSDVNLIKAKISTFLP